jgi:tRNA threonylcarbamoyladenosine biosynthesis protein TsaE
MSTFVPSEPNCNPAFQQWLQAHAADRVLPDLAAMEAFAQSLAAVLPMDTTLALSGDLGTGKTTFVRFLAAALGITEPIKSPTFNLYAYYDGPLRLLHCDAYRLRNGREMDALLLDEYLTSPWVLCVEWPENIREWMPTHPLNLQFAIKQGVHSVQVVDAF